MVTHEHDIADRARRIVTLRDGLIESADAELATGAAVAAGT